MAAIVIFVAGADTDPDPLPVYFLDNQEHATLICEGMNESEYGIFKFSIKSCTRSDRGKFAVWAEMTIDVRDGVYGSIAAGIYNMIDRAHAIISQRRINQETVANPNTKVQSDYGWVLPSSKLENPTKTDNNFNASLAREQLRRYVEMREFRHYVMEKITQWELWYHSRTEEIKYHEGERDRFHQELKELQGRDSRHSDEPADFDLLLGAETCYEGHRDLAAALNDDPEYKLVADREPVLFKEASVVAIVALFWCDVNHSSLLAPEFDFFSEREEPFREYLGEQWQNPVQGRYKYIDWFVEAAISAYENTIASEDVDKSQEHEPPIDADDELDKACEEELQSALRKHEIRTEVAPTLTPEQRRNIIMAHWGCTPSKARDRWIETKWRPFLGKESKTKLADKVKSFIKRGRDKLKELASRK